MKSDNLIMYIIEISLIIFLLCFIFFSNIFTKAIMAIVLLVFMIVSHKLIKSYKQKGRYNKKVTSLMIIIGIVYLALIYILGIYIGFYNATVKLSNWSLVHYIIPYIVIIVSIENIRKTILLKENKKSNIIFLIATVMLDVALTTNIYNVKTLNDYFMLIGVTMFSSIANNILYNYIIIKYRNCKAIIGYRLITMLYVFIIPIIPNIHILFEAILRIIVPYIIYLILEANYSKKEKKLPTIVKTKDIVITSILVILAGGIVMLISCQFKYGVLVIGSGSMTGTINKGDVIIYEKLNEDEVIEVGEIIVFNSDKVRVIHRVIDKKDFGNGMKYYTKGDANPNRDEGYRVEDDIVGKVRLRIPYIGQFTILLNEMFEPSRRKWRIKMEKNKSKEDIILYHQTKRKKHKIKLGITAGILIVIALILIGTYGVLNKEHAISYKETSDINYRVNLIENDFYKENYLDEGIDVISNLIKNIDVEFKYNLELAEEVEYKYSYKILAETEVKEKSKTNLLYESEQQLINKVNQNGKTKKIEINEKIVLDYNKYNNQINRLIEEYKLLNTTSELHLSMYLNITNKATGEIINKANKVMSIVMPLTTKTVEITVNENVKNTEGKILIQENEYKNSKYFLPIGIFILIIGVIILGNLIKYISDTRSAEKMYDDELKKILFDYKSYIQKVNNKVDYKGYKTIKIDTFKELLAMREEIQSPILMYTEENYQKTTFIIMNGNLLFEYILEARLIREELIKRSKEKEAKRSENNK